MATSTSTINANQAGLKYLKVPRSVAEYTLMKGVTDFSNLKQFDLFETGYSFLTVLSVPKFMEQLAQKDSSIRNLQDGFVQILEGEFKGLSGIPDISADTGDISNGISNTAVINNVTMETNINVSLSFYERSGGLLTNYLQYYITGIKDPYSKAKTYHGLIASGEINDPGPSYEVFNFLYYVTDNTMRRIERAYLLANAQMTTAPLSTLYNPSKGDYSFAEVDVSFNCFPIMGNTVNKYAVLMLQNDLAAEEGDRRRLVLDYNDFKFDALKSDRSDFYTTDVSSMNNKTDIKTVLNQSDPDISSNNNLIIDK